MTNNANTNGRNVVADTYVPDPMVDTAELRRITDEDPTLPEAPVSPSPVNTLRPVRPVVCLACRATVECMCPESVEARRLALELADAQERAEAAETGRARLEAELSARLEVSETEAARLRAQVEAGAGINGSAVAVRSVRARLGQWVQSWPFYVTCLTGALYGMHEVLTRAVGIDDPFAWVFSIALELAGIRFKAAADARKDDGEDGGLDEWIAWTIAIGVVAFNAVGHVMLGEAVAAAFFGVMSALGFTSWVRTAAHKRRARERAAGRAEQTHLKIPGVYADRFGKPVVERARIIAGLDTTGELTLAGVIEQAGRELAEEAAADETAARHKRLADETAARHTRLLKLVFEDKARELGDENLARQEIDGMDPAKLIARLTATDDEHDAAAAAIKQRIADQRERRARELAGELAREPSGEPSKGSLLSRLVSPKRARNELAGEPGGEPSGEPSVSPRVSPARARREPASELSKGSAVSPRVSPEKAHGEPTVETGEGSVRPVPQSVEGVSNDTAARWIANQINRHGKRPSPTDVAKKYDISESTAKRWTAAVDQAMTDLVKA